MAVIHEDAAVHEHYNDRSGISWVVGLILVILLAWLLFNIGLPALRAPVTDTQSPQINVNAPQGGAPNQGGNPAQNPAGDPNK